jgi:hypothetical protein
MSWHIFFEGSREAVRVAVVESELPRAHVACAANFEWARGVLLELLDRQPANLTGVRLRAAGEEKTISVLEVEGRVFTL